MKHIVSIIMNKYKDKYSSDKLEIAEYGLKVILLTITKLSLIIIVVSLLGILKEFILFYILFNIVRLFSFGLHASKSIYCTISSLIVFTIVPYLNSIIFLSFNFKCIIGILLILLMYKNSPADTIKKPIIRRRNIYKFMSTIIAILFVFLSLINNGLITNTLITSLIVQNILISSYTYKLFKMPYNNYINYMKGGLYVN